MYTSTFHCHCLKASVRLANNHVLLLLLYCCFTAALLLRFFCVTAALLLPYFPSTGLANNHATFEKKRKAMKGENTLYTCVCVCVCVCVSTYIYIFIYMYTYIQKQIYI